MVKWTPEWEPHEEQALKTGYVSDNTLFMRWSTEMETKKNVSDDAFMERNKLQILALDKFPALAFYEDPRMIRLRKLKIMNAILAENAGLTQTAEETVLSTIDDVQASRGWKGNYSKVLITQRHEVDTKEMQQPMQRKANWFNRFVGGRSPAEEQAQQQRR